MKEFLKYALIFTSIIFLMVSCEKKKPDEEKEKEEEFVPYTPPEQINTLNLYKVCLFSTLSDESLFATKSKDVVYDFISNLSGQKPVMFMMERSDFTKGNSLPHLDIACKYKAYSYFYQYEKTSNSVKGTGIVTRYLANEIDGVANDTLHISGCNISVPVSTSVTLYLYNTRITSKNQIENLISHRKDILQTKGVVYGSISSDIKTDVETYLKKNFKDYRLYYAGEENKKYDLFVLSPVDLVCRGIEKGEKVGIPYYIVSVELLSDVNVK